VEVEEGGDGTKKEFRVGKEGESMEMRVEKEEVGNRFLAKRRRRNMIELFF
jgi:hypothetical protein